MQKIEFSYGVQVGVITLPNTNTKQFNEFYDFLTSLLPGLESEVLVLPGSKLKYLQTANINEQVKINSLAWDYLSFLYDLQTKIPSSKILQNIELLKKDSDSFATKQADFYMDTSTYRQAFVCELVASALEFYKIDSFNVEMPKVKIQKSIMGLSGINPDLLSNTRKYIIDYFPPKVPIVEAKPATPFSDNSPSLPIDSIIVACNNLASAYLVANAAASKRHSFEWRLLETTYDCEFLIKDLQGELIYSTQSS